MLFGHCQTIKTFQRLKAVLLNHNIGFWGGGGLSPSVKPRRIDCSTSVPLESEDSITPCDINNFIKPLSMTAFYLMTTPHTTQSAPHKTMRGQEEELRAESADWAGVERLHLRCGGGVVSSKWVGKIMRSNEINPLLKVTILR